MFIDEATNMLQDENILLDELKKRADKGTHRERKLFLLAKEYLESIRRYNIDNNEAICEYDYINKAELFVVELLGKERLSKDSISSISTRELFLLCISIRIRIGNKQIYEYLKTNNRSFASTTDLWNDFLHICNRKIYDDCLENDNISDNSGSRSFVIDLLTIVDEAFSFLNKPWICVSDKYNHYCPVKVD